MCATTPYKIMCQILT